MFSSWIPRREGWEEEWLEAIYLVQVKAQMGKVSVLSERVASKARSRSKYQDVLTVGEDFGQMSLRTRLRKIRVMGARYFNLCYFHLGG